MGQDVKTKEKKHTYPTMKQSFNGILGKPKTCFYLVVEPTHLKNISQNRNIPQLGVTNQTYLSCHHLVFFYYLKISDPRWLLGKPNWPWQKQVLHLDELKIPKT